MKPYLCFVFWMLLAVRISYGQENCNLRYEEALRDYYSGNLREVEPLLNNCLDKFDKQRQQEALRLIVLSNLYLRNLTVADNAMIKLLMLNPEFQPSGSDPLEFKQLFSSFNSNPVFSIGFSGGINAGQYELIQHYSIVSNPSLSTSEYNGKPGWQVGFTGAYHLTNSVWIGLQFFFENRKIENHEIQFRANEITLVENQARIELPVSIRYIPFSGKYRPYGEIGYAPNYLLRDHGRISGENIENKTVSEIYDFSLLDNRVKFNHKIFAGIGLLRKIKGGFIDLNLRYHYELENQAVNTPNYNQPKLVLDYYYLGNDFRANVFSISIGYIKIFYRPKKILPNEK